MQSRCAQAAKYQHVAATFVDVRPFLEYDPGQHNGTSPHSGNDRSMVRGKPRIPGIFYKSGWDFDVQAVQDVEKILACSQEVMSKLDEFNLIRLHSSLHVIHTKIVFL